MDAKRVARWSPADSLGRNRVAVSALALLALIVATLRPVPADAPTWGAPVMLTAGAFLLV